MKRMLRSGWLVAEVALALGMTVGTLLFSVETSAEDTASDAFFSPSQTYEVFFSLHPRELDRLSNARLVGVKTLGSKTYLRFQSWLNNQLEEGLIDLQTVSAILPSTVRLVSTPEVMLDRQPFDQTEKVKEIRSETVREVIREVPASKSER